MSDHNFQLLKNDCGILALVGEIAERNVYQNPNLCMSELRKFAEMITKYILANEEMTEKDQTNQLERLKMLFNEQIIPKEIYDYLMLVSLKGNKAYQNYAYAKVADAKVLLRMSFRVAKWYVEVYGEQSIGIPNYEEPVPHNPISDRELIQLLDEYEQKMAQVEKELARIRQSYNLLDDQEKQKRKERSHIISANYKLTKEEENLIID